MIRIKNYAIILTRNVGGFLYDNIRRNKKKIMGWS